MTSDHPAAHFERSIIELRRRATLAIVALGVTMAVRTWDVGARAWTIGLVRTMDSDPGTITQAQLETADSLVDFGLFATVLMMVVTAIFFLRWIHRLVKLTRSLGAEDLRWKPSEAVWAFLIPFISLFRPYQVLRDVQQRLEPEEIEPPSVQLDRNVETDYRSVAFVVPPAPKPLPNSLLGLWWGSYVAVNVMGRVANSFGKHSSSIDSIMTSYELAIFTSALAVVVAVLAVGVIRSLTARLGERFRRIRHSTPESLTAQRIVLGSV